MLQSACFSLIFGQARASSASTFAGLHGFSRRVRAGSRWRVQAFDDPKASNYEGRRRPCRNRSTLLELALGQRRPIGTNLDGLISSKSSHTITGSLEESGSLQLLATE